MEDCSATALCKTMTGQLVMSGRGLQQWDQVQNGKVVLMGVLFKGAGDRPILVNYCPWCGKSPGMQVSATAKKQDSTEQRKALDEAWERDPDQ